MYVWTHTSAHLDVAYPHKASRFPLKILRICRWPLTLKRIRKYSLQPMKRLVITMAILIRMSPGGHTHGGIKQRDCPE